MDPRWLVQDYLASKQQLIDAIAQCNDLDVLDTMATQAQQRYDDLQHQMRRESLPELIAHIRQFVRVCGDFDMRDNGNVLTLTAIADILEHYT